MSYSSREEVAQGLMGKKPGLVLVRRRYVERFPDTIIGRMVNSAAFK